MFTVGYRGRVEHLVRGAKDHCHLCTSCMCRQFLRGTHIHCKKYFSEILAFGVYSRLDYLCMKNLSTVLTFVFFCR